MRSLHLISLFSVAVLLACGSEVGDDGHREDAGSLSDAGPGSDAGSGDGGAGFDAGPDASANDGGAPGLDGGPPATCDPALGQPCDETDRCPGGFECQIGRCAPQGRQACGGFAGATCPAPYVDPCLHYTSADFGPCLTPEERSCACAFTNWLDCR